MGLSGIPSPDKLTLFLYSSVLVILAVFLMFTFGRSRHGRAVISIREDEIAAESSGVNTTYYKLMAFVLAAFLAGIAGGLYAHHVGMVDPSKYDFNRSVEFLIMVVLGGMGSITGSIISATVLTILPQMLTDFDRVPYADLFHYSDRSDAVPSHRPVGPVRDFGYRACRQATRPDQGPFPEERGGVTYAVTGNQGPGH